MDILLIILGALGLSALVLSAYVFTVAARRYVSDEDSQALGPQNGSTLAQGRPQVERRSDEAASFPLSINGRVIARDRRRRPERRINLF